MESDSLEPVARRICAERGLTFGAAVGAGAFKHTFRVTTQGGSTVALKVYRPAASLSRAQREIEAMLVCDHPNIAKVQSVDVIADGDRQNVFCLEEYLAGGTLAEAVTHGPLAPAEARRLIGVLASALQHLEERGLVHRDLKPENIMLRGDQSTPVIVDFGIVRKLGAVSMTPTWAVQGPCTPFFAPAEQLANEKLAIDWRADQFSLGVTFCCITLGFHPYAESSTEDPNRIIARVASKQSPPPNFAAAAIAAGLEPLIKMVAPWPVGRYRRPDDLIAAWRL